VKNYATAIRNGHALLSLDGGACGGPLFNEYGKRRTRILNTSRAHGARRRARERRATPAWLAPAQRAELRVIHHLCVLMNQWRAPGTPEYHVAHIVPLASPIVCGLNVPWNLEIKLGKLNLKEGNGTWPDMPFTQLELL